MARSRNKIESWVIEQRSQLRGVSTMQICLQAKEFAKEMKIGDLGGGSFWCVRFMKRKILSIRTRTTMSQ